jgi:hypothetical protein
MKNWNGFLSFLSRFHKLWGLLLLFILCAGKTDISKAQALQAAPEVYRYSYQSVKRANDHLSPPDTIKPARKYPDPHKVLFRSLMVPGWGQIINKQAYKVPIIYLLLSGLTGYSIYLTKRYHDYRAAYYNKTNTNSDHPNGLLFGPTPAYLQNADPSFLKKKRNVLHNRRDFMYITIVLAYGLNALDAYIFAHLRSFDVSKNLSVRPSVKPGMVAQAVPGVTFSFSLNKR